MAINGSEQEEKQQVVSLVVKCTVHATICSQNQSEVCCVCFPTAVKVIVGISKNQLRLGGKETPHLNVSVIKVKYF